MNDYSSDYIDPKALGGVSGGARNNSRSTDFFERVRKEAEFWNSGLASGRDPYQAFVSGRIGPQIERANRNGHIRPSVNFASQDYLSLWSSPLIIKHGGSCSDQPRRSFRWDCCSFSKYNFFTRFVFPFRWPAGFGVITVSVKPEDHVVIDDFSRECLERCSTTRSREIMWLASSTRSEKAARRSFNSHIATASKAVRANR